MSVAAGGRLGRRGAGPLLLIRCESAASGRAGYPEACGRARSRSWASAKTSCIGQAVAKAILMRRTLHSTRSCCWSWSVCSRTAIAGLKSPSSARRGSIFCAASARSRTAHHRTINSATFTQRSMTNSSRVASSPGLPSGRDPEWCRRHRCKMLRRSYQDGGAKAPIHMISAWSTGQNLVLEVKGLFADSLPEFVQYYKQFRHVDCDLYGSTITCLTANGLHGVSCERNTV